MTTVQEHATLTRMDDARRQALEDAAGAYKQAPAALRDTIIAAGRSGERPADIVKAIGYVFTYDYVARIVRQDRADHPGEYPQS